MATLNEIETFLNITVVGKVLHNGKRKKEKNRYYRFRNEYYIISLTRDMWMIADDTNLTRDLLQDHYFHCNSNNYTMTYVNKKKVGIHRLITDCDDDNVPDHINRKRFDNRKNNLREVTNTINRTNLTTSKRNSTGKQGVCRAIMGRFNYYRVQITDNNGQIIAKHFNIDRLGDNEAKRQATRHRKMLERLYGYQGE
jgi:hypothetical protein